MIRKIIIVGLAVGAVLMGGTCLWTYHRPILHIYELANRWHITRGCFDLRHQTYISKERETQPRSLRLGKFLMEVDVQKNWLSPSELRWYRQDPQMHSQLAWAAKVDKVELAP